jgi:hypothetical protein
VWKITPSFPSRELSVRISALNPSAVDETTINVSPLSWAVRPPRHDCRNQARKARTSLYSEIKMGLLFRRCPAGKQVLATWSCGVLPSGLPLRGPDMSLDMRLFAVSVETADLDGSESMAVGLGGPLSSCGVTSSANTAAYVAPPLDGPSCRLPAAACSPVTDKSAGRSADPVSGAGRLLADSIESPELSSSLALRLPASWLEAFCPPPRAVLRLPAATAVFFFFLDASADLSSLRRAGDTCKQEIALRRANAGLRFIGPPFILNPGCSSWSAIGQLAELWTWLDEWLSVAWGP